MLALTTANVANDNGFKVFPVLLLWLIRLGCKY